MTATEPKWMKIAGYVLSGLCIAFFLMDAGMKFANLDVVKSTTRDLGWSESSVTTLGVILLLCTILYAVPQTAVLGAILLTGYLGGAVATHVRIASPLFSHVLFGVYLGVMIWAGLYLRVPALRGLLPLRRQLTAL